MPLYFPRDSREERYAAECLPLDVGKVVVLCDCAMFALMMR